MESLLSFPAGLTPYNMPFTRRTPNCRQTTQYPPVPELRGVTWSGRAEGFIPLRADGAKE